MGTGEIISIISIAAGLLFGIIGFFLKRAFNQVDRLEAEKASKAELQEVKNLYDEHGRTIGDIKTSYLTKEDFFREQAKTDRKLDEIMRILLDIKGGVKNG
jgi:hypothetical protein